MAANLNKVFLAGNLTRDPEVRYIPSGTAVSDLRLAVNESYRESGSSEWKERTLFVDVVVWGRQAETAGEYLSKGSPVLVEGRLQLDEWETPQGEKRSKMRVRADRLQFLSAPTRDGSGHGTAGGGRSAPEPGPRPQAESPSHGTPDRELESDEDNLPF
jgi:single-strand DNA-binding protein